MKPSQQLEFLQNSIRDTKQKIESLQKEIVFANNALTVFKQSYKLLEESFCPHCYGKGQVYEFSSDTFMFCKKCNGKGLRE